MNFHLFNATMRWCNICVAEKGSCLMKGGSPNNKQHNNRRKRVDDIIDNKLILMNPKREG